MVELFYVYGLEYICRVRKYLYRKTLPQGYGRMELRNFPVQGKQYSEKSIAPGICRKRPIGHGYIDNTRGECDPMENGGCLFPVQLWVYGSLPPGSQWPV